MNSAQQKIVERVAELLRAQNRGLKDIGECAAIPTRTIEQVASAVGRMFKPSGSMARSWICLNCGGDHGYGGCDDPDFDSIQFYCLTEDLREDG